MLRSSRRLRRAAPAALLLVALASCSNDDAEPQMPESTSPAASSSSPSATADPTVEPTLPPEAEGNDEAAAEAFVRYYWDVVDYAQLTGDLSTLETLTLPSCASCEAGNDYLRKLYKQGGSLAGVDYIVDRVVAKKRSEREPFSTYRAEADLHNGPYTERASSTDEPVAKPAGDGTAVMSLTWDKTGFSVSDWVLQ